MNPEFGRPGMKFAVFRVSRTRFLAIDALALIDSPVVPHDRGALAARPNLAGAETIRTPDLAG
jgi:hypothetical protein